MEYLRKKHIVDIETQKFLDDIYEPINEVIEYDIVTSEELEGSFKINETNPDYITVTYCKLFGVEGIFDVEVYDHILDNSTFIKSNLSDVRNMYVDSLINGIEEKLYLEIKDLDDEAEYESVRARINNEIIKLKRKKR